MAGVRLLWPPKLKLYGKPQGAEKPTRLAVGRRGEAASQERQAGNPFSKHGSRGWPVSEKGDIECHMLSLLEVVQTLAGRFRPKADIRGIFRGTGE